ncbi:MAG: YhbY family RNA-binding protein [Clostridia bacterium]|nr:YhbY family RNA-binding protein [Clostridia bacterium]
MLTSKQRAFLRGLATNRNTLMQIGKGGVTENVIAQINMLLEANELVKIHCLENTLVDARTVCDEVAELIPGCEPVCCIGRRFVIYKESRENKQIDIVKMRLIPKEEPKKSAASKPKTADKRRVSAGAKHGTRGGAGKGRFADTSGAPRGSRGGFGRRQSKKQK